MLQSCEDPTETDIKKAELSNRSTSLSSEDFTVDEVLQSLKVLKPHQSPDSDSMHSMILKELIPLIAPILTELFNQSLASTRLLAK